ncbi:hypothetical protein LJC00_03850 [Dysgonomonas sp. OttesenSCG-928-M03]|nr:hypothetical protein [Dysgonomonas sp. OttesenSCG-928-M03]
MRLGNTGGKNKGKKYLKITGQEEITEENQMKANRFKEWFSRNYVRIQIELIAKRTYNEDILNDTFLRIYDKILFGGLDIADYKAYFHRAFFTNYVQENMKQQEIARMFVPDDHAVDTFDDTIEELRINQQKMQLYKDILHYVKDKFDEPDYNLFDAYVKLGSRRYNSVCDLLQLSHETVSGTVGKIKRSIRSNHQFVSIRKSM